MGYRDLVMSTEGISLNIVENAVSEEVTKGDLKKAWERLERRWNPKTRFLNNKLENTRQRPMDWITFMEKKQAELMNTGHIMDDETFITHLLNVKNSSSLFFQISCSQGILNSSRLSSYLLLRLLVYMYLSQLMRTFTNYPKCIVISS